MTDLLDLLTRDADPCRFCGGNPAEPDHARRCDGRQGRVEAQADYDPHVHARTADPDTSHAAAWSVTEASMVQARVYALHQSHPDGLTDEELVLLYARAHAPGRSLESRASPRKRRSDLARTGVLVDSGERRVLTSGRRGVVWKLTQQPSSECSLSSATEPLHARDATR
jgi:hypothetical protein